MFVNAFTCLSFTGNSFFLQGGDYAVKSYVSSGYNYMVNGRTLQGFPAFLSSFQKESDKETTEIPVVLFRFLTYLPYD